MIRVAIDICGVYECFGDSRYHISVMFPIKTVLGSDIAYQGAVGGLGCPVQETRPKPEQ